jgi:hypothetical protein
MIPPHVTENNRDSISGKLEKSENMEKLTVQSKYKAI